METFPENSKSFYRQTDRPRLFTSQFHNKKPKHFQPNTIYTGRR